MDRLQSFQDVTTIKGNEIVGAGVWNPLANAIKGAHSLSDKLDVKIDAAGRLTLDLDDMAMAEQCPAIIAVYNFSPSVTIHEGAPLDLYNSQTNGAVNARWVQDYGAITRRCPAIAMGTIPPGEYGYGIISGVARVLLEDKTYSDGGYIYRTNGGQYGNQWAQGYAGPHEILSISGDYAFVKVNSRYSFYDEIWFSNGHHRIGFTKDMSGISAQNVAGAYLTQDGTTKAVTWVTGGSSAQSWTWADLFTLPLSTGQTKYMSLVLSGGSFVVVPEANTLPICKIDIAQFTSGTSLYSAHIRYYQEVNIVYTGGVVPA